MYDFEQNFVIDCFWDDGFTVRFGDIYNRFTEIRYVDTWQKVEDIFKKKLEELKNESRD